VLVQCSSLLVMPVGTPSVSLPVNVQEGFLIPVALLHHVLLHWLGGSGHADFFLHVVGDGPQSEMQLDSASWQNGNHCAVCVGVSGHVVPRKFVGIDIQLCGEGQLFTCSLLVLVPFCVQHSWAGSDWQQVMSGPNLGQHIMTCHKNLVHKHFNTERVVRWRLLVEEFGPQLTHIKGANDIAADALSRLDITEEDFSQDAFNGELAAGDDKFPDEFPLL